MKINCYDCGCIIEGDIKQVSHPVMKQILIQCCCDCYEKRLNYKNQKNVINHVYDSNGKIISETINKLNDSLRTVFYYKYYNDIKRISKIIEYFQNETYITTYNLIRDEFSYGIKLTFYKKELLGGITIFDEQNNFSFKQFFDNNLFNRNFDISNVIKIENKEFNIRIKHINKISIEYWINGNLNENIYYSNYI